MDFRHIEETVEELNRLTSSPDPADRWVYLSRFKGLTDYVSAYLEHYRDGFIEGFLKTNPGMQEKRNRRQTNM